jgi:hypothetical protein
MLLALAPALTVGLVLPSVASTSLPRTAEIVAKARHAHASAVFGRVRVPDAVCEVLDPAVDIDEVAPLWKEFRAVFPTEEAAIRAARRNTAVILPFINSADNIRFCWQVLGELGFSKEEALEIVTKNPGVLGNKPGLLARSSQAEVRFSMGLVGALDELPEPVRLAIPPLTCIALVVGIARRLSECAGGVCGGDF